jgi:hypothetical protein
MARSNRQAIKTQIAQTKTVPAPIGGLNARDSIAEMPPTDAVAISNWFPTTSSLIVRNGSANWATGLPAWVETLAVYSPNSGSRQLFGASGGNLYNCTAQGAVGAPVVTGNTSNRWQYVNFSNPGGQWLYLVNGQDSPQLYNGSSWQAVTAASSPISITGVTDGLTNLIAVTAFKSRLYFIAKNTFHVWYLAVNAVGGAATLLDLSSIFQLGGYLIAAFSWTWNNVAGPQDYMVFLSSEGEGVIYQGYDPSQSGSWSQVGTFRMGRPVGYRCWARVGTDVMIMCADGLIPLTQEILNDRQSPQAEVTLKIRNAIQQDFQNYSTHFGWQVILHPMGTKLFINVPQSEDSVQYQYVMNTITSAWTVFNGWNAACFALMGDQLFYGTQNKVILCDTGATDLGASIQTNLIPAYSYFDAPGQNKQFTMCRPTFSLTGNIGISVGLSVDYRPVTLNASLSLPPSTGTSFWNTSLWNIAPWSQTSVIRLAWESVTGVGYAASLNMATLSNISNVSLIAIDYVYQMGGVL